MLNLREIWPIFFHAFLWIGRGGGRWVARREARAWELESGHWSQPTEESAAARERITLQWLFATAPSSPTSEDSKSATQKPFLNYLYSCHFLLKPNQRKQKIGNRPNTKSIVVKPLLNEESSSPTISLLIYSDRQREGGGKKSRVTLQCYSASREVAVASQPATDADLLRGEIHNKTITL